MWSRHFGLQFKKCALWVHGFRCTSDEVILSPKKVKYLVVFLCHYI
jgi:hypothetical protein